MKRLGRILSSLLLVILALAVLAGLLGAYTVRRSFPQVNGTLQLPGLTSQVDIYRDGLGVPHIYAGNAHDLFLAQGYVHAQDRFYQMDFWRHQTAGRLSELYGKAALGRDKFLRTVGWRRVAEQEYASAEPEIRAALEAYAEGVNLYIQSRPAADLSLEYSILGVIGLANYQPEPWTPPDSLAWAKAMAWNLSGNMDDEITRAILNQAIGEARTDDYMPLYPSDHPVIVPNPATGQAPAAQAGVYQADPATLAVLQNLQGQIASVNESLGGHFEGIGSNSWVVSGQRTDTGKPLLANDPHLAIQMPAIWYEVGLHCRPRSADCPYDVTGFSLAGDPGVIIGHNDRIAWGATNLGPDVQDLVIERINPQNPDEYMVNGEWVEMSSRQEVIRLRDGGWETLTVRYTRHGPLITDVYGLADFAQEAGLDPAYQYAFALRWTALEPSRLFQSVFEINKARNWYQFRDALRDWAVPSQNFVYADVDGNIGYQSPGNIPIRRNGDGLLPVPGWTDDYEWTGYIPFDELPVSFNPPQGYIVTANNAVVGPDYPHLLALDWDSGYRAQRIVDMVDAQPRISIAYIQQMQGDDLNLGATEVLPYLLKLEFEDPKLDEAQHALRQWDYQLRMDSQPAAIYMSFFNALLARTFHDDLPESDWPGGGGGNWLTLRAILPEANNRWWDDAGTPAVETRDDILRQAFAEGMAALEAQLGPESKSWAWGQLHTSTFANETLGTSASPAPIRALFNRGPFPTAGGGSMVNNTGSNLSRDDRANPGDPYATASLPSMRMIVDLGNLDNSLTVHTTGQSGHAYHPHYIDMADLWRNIQYHPMLWSAAEVEAGAESHLILKP